uniref:Uncharacterized protein n=1 Tax=Ascaris lumbricoides TaxID=6252 RepID=A0A0M3HLL3_ASCLU
MKREVDVRRNRQSDKSKGVAGRGKGESRDVVVGDYTLFQGISVTSDSSTCVSSSPTVTVNSSLLNSGMGMMPAHTQHVFHTLENQQAVNILYVDETSGHQHTIHYVDMDNDTQMDA